MNSTSSGAHAAFRRSWIKAAHMAFMRLLPIHLHLLLATVAVVVFHEAVLHAKLVHTFGDLHIVAAVFGDLGHLTLLPPFERIEAVGSLAHAERGRGDGIELDAMAERLFEIDEKVEAVKLVTVSVAGRNVAYSGSASVGLSGGGP